MRAKQKPKHKHSIIEETRTGGSSCLLEIMTDLLQAWTLSGSNSYTGLTQSAAAVPALSCPLEIIPAWLFAACRIHNRRRLHVVILCAMSSGGSWPCLLRSARHPAALRLLWVPAVQVATSPASSCSLRRSAPVPSGFQASGGSSDRFLLIPCDDSGGSSGRVPRRCCFHGRAPGFVSELVRSQPRTAFSTSPMVFLSLFALLALPDPEGEPTYHAPHMEVILCPKPKT